MLEKFRGSVQTATIATTGEGLVRRRAWHRPEPVVLLGVHQHVSPDEIPDYMKAGRKLDITVRSYTSPVSTGRYNQHVLFYGRPGLQPEFAGAVNRERNRRLSRRAVV